MDLEKQTAILQMFKEGKYSCDDRGIVFSQGNVLGQRVTTNGYRMVTLCKVPRRLDCLTHQVGNINNIVLRKTWKETGDASRRN